MRAPFALGGFEGMKKADACAQLTGLPSHEFVVDELRIQTCEERIYRRVDAWVVMFYMFFIVSSVWNAWKVLTLLPAINLKSEKQKDPAKVEAGRKGAVARNNKKEREEAEHKRLLHDVQNWRLDMAYLRALSPDTRLGDALQKLPSITQSPCASARMELLDQ
jgi:hypothetical protein